MKFFTKCSAGILSLAVGAFLLAGCGGEGKKKLRLAFVTNNSSDFWTIARKGTEQAAAELGDVEVLFKMPS